MACRRTWTRSVARNARGFDLVEHRIGGAVAGRLAADRVDAAIGTALVGPLHQFVVDVGFGEIDRLGAAGFRHRQPLGHLVDCDHAAGAQQQRRADRELADGPAAPDRHGIPGLDLGIDGGHVAGREDVRKKERLLIGHAVRNLDRTDVRHRHPEILGLAAGIAAEHVAETEQPGGRLPHRLGRHLGIGVGAVAARKQPLLAEPALSAADGEGNDHPVADLEVGDLGSELDHLAHVLVAEDVAALHGRLVSVEQMKVRAADRTRGDLDDRVAGVLDLRIRNRVDPDVAFSVPA